MEITPHSDAVYPAASARGTDHQQVQEQTQRQPENQPAARLEVSDLARSYTEAVGQLEEKQAVRPDVVAEAKELLANFEAPTDAEVDSIMDNLLNEL